MIYQERSDKWLILKRFISFQDLRALCLLMSVTEANELTTATPLEECINSLLERHNQLSTAVQERSMSDEKESSGRKLI